MSFPCSQALRGALGDSPALAVPWGWQQAGVQRHLSACPRAVAPAEAHHSVPHSPCLITLRSSSPQEAGEARNETLERGWPLERTIRISRVVIIHADNNFGKDVQLFTSGFKPSGRDRGTWSERRGVEGQITSLSGYGRGPAPPHTMQLWSACGEAQGSGPWAGPGAISCLPCPAVPWGR